MIVPADIGGSAGHRRIRVHGARSPGPPLALVYIIYLLRSHAECRGGEGISWIRPIRRARLHGNAARRAHLERGIGSDEPAACVRRASVYEVRWRHVVDPLPTRFTPRPIDDPVPHGRRWAPAADLHGWSAVRHSVRGSPRWIRDAHGAGPSVSRGRRGSPRGSSHRHPRAGRDAGWFEVSRRGGGSTRGSPRSSVFGWLPAKVRMLPTSMGLVTPGLPRDTSPGIM